MGVGLELELAPRARARPRTAHLHLAPAEHDLPRARAVPAGAALGVVLALGADERNQLLLEQLVQHLQADADRECEQALAHRARQVVEGELHLARQAQPVELVSPRDPGP